MEGVNLCKSKVFGIGVDDIDIAMLASILHCESASFPFSYLGLPIGDNMKLTRNWNPIVKKFNAKLSLWKARSLSFGGRLTIVKSNLSSLPLYYFSNFKAPKKIIELLEELFTTSIVLMENLWLNVEIRGWNRTHFWKEKWCGDITLKDTFPKLYKIESNKNCKKRLPRKGKEMAELEGLEAVVAGLMALNLGANGNMADFQWVSWVPIKVNCFIWRLLYSMIPFAYNLLLRGVVINELSCKWCGSEMESIEHVFFN
uniref:Reverse transcriptase zinc-binding domain-containing protein n=1 Tax=Lactuca sativa TaxID=4236 RepID=A0A9R1X6U4_LACSA|nr:hypothetical protein LSAT_V11C600315980 [Lactuca sativa]